MFTLSFQISAKVLLNLNGDASIVSVLIRTVICLGVWNTGG